MRGSVHAKLMQTNIVHCTGQATLCKNNNGNDDNIYNKNKNMITIRKTKILIIRIMINVQKHNCQTVADQQSKRHYQHKIESHWATITLHCQRDKKTFNLLRCKI